MSIIIRLYKIIFPTLHLVCHELRVIFLGRPVAGKQIAKLYFCVSSGPPRSVRAFSTDPLLAVITLTCHLLTKKRGSVILTVR